MQLRDRERAENKPTVKREDAGYRINRPVAKAPFWSGHGNTKPRKGVVRLGVIYLNVYRLWVARAPPDRLPHTPIGPYRRFKHQVKWAVLHAADVHNPCGFACWSVQAVCQMAPIRCARKQDAARNIACFHMGKRAANHPCPHGMAHQIYWARRKFCPYLADQPGHLLSCGLRSVPCLPYASACGPAKCNGRSVGMRAGQAHGFWPRDCARIAALGFAGQDMLVWAMACIIGQEAVVMGHEFV